MDSKGDQNNLNQAFNEGSKFSAENIDAFAGELLQMSTGSYAGDLSKELKITSSAESVETSEKKPEVAPPPETARTGDPKPEQVEVISADSSEIVELYKKPPKGSSSASTSQDSVLLPPLKISRTGYLQRQTSTLRRSNTNLDGKKLVAGSSARMVRSLVGSRPNSTSSRISVASTVSPRSAASPRTANTRGLEAELKIAKKKFFESKKELDLQETTTNKIANSILLVVDRISHVLGRERPLDDQLKEIRNYAALRMEGNASNIANPISVDLSGYQNNLFEIDKTWFETLQVVVNYAKNLMLFLEAKKIRLPPSFDDMSTIERQIKHAKEAASQKRMLVLSRFEDVVSKAGKAEESYVQKIKNCENIIKEQDFCLAKSRQASDELKEENESFVSKQKAAHEKHQAEISMKNKEIKNLSVEIAQLHNAAKNAVKLAADKEKEHKESVSALSKQIEEACRREKELKRKLDDVNEKLANVHVREMAAKKMELSCQSEEETRAGLVAEFERIKKEKNLAETMLAQARSVAGRMKFELRETKEEAAMLEQDLLKAREALRLAEGNTAKVPRKAMKSEISREALEELKERISVLNKREAEVRVREARLARQNVAARVYDVLEKIVKTREVRRENPSAYQHEAVLQLLEEKRNTIDAMRSKIQGLKKKRHEELMRRGEASNDSKRTDRRKKSKRSPKI